MSRLLVVLAALTGLLSAGSGVARAQTPCGFSNGDFSQDWTDWSTDYVKSTDLFPAARVSIASSFSQAAPAWSQYVIGNFGAVNFSAPSTGNVVVVNASTSAGQRVLYRSVSGLVSGRSYRASFAARRIVAPGAIRVQVGSAAPLDQPISTLSVTTWTRLSVPFTASSTSTSVSFSLAETSGASFGADFALADFRLEDGSGQVLGSDCRPSTLALAARVVRLANVGTSRAYEVTLTATNVTPGTGYSFKVTSAGHAPSSGALRSITASSSTLAWTYQLKDPRGVFRAQVFLDADTDGTADRADQVAEVTVK